MRAKLLSQSFSRPALAVALCALIIASEPGAAGQRESLGAAFDPASDISDVYAFRSWERPDKLVLIMNVFPMQNPNSGPTFFPFDDDVIYRLHIDNDMDGVADDVVYEISFTTEKRPTPGFAAGSPFPYLGNPRIPIPGLQGITALDGAGSEGLTLRQQFSVTELRNDRKGHRKPRLFADKPLFAVPSNVGPVTMPDYEALAAQGIHADSHAGVRVFAGQRAETFYRDLGALLDGLSFRRDPPFLSPAEDNDNGINPFGINRFRHTNVNSIALEIPIDRVTRDGKSAGATSWPFIGVYASTHRPRTTVRGLDEHDKVRGKDETDERIASRRHGGGSRYVQVSRMGNPMYNTLVTPFMQKDAWNQSRPEHDIQFQEHIKDPVIAQLLSQTVGVPVPPPPRVDLIQVLLKYPGQTSDGPDCGFPCADLLRLNLRVPPTPPENQHRLGALLSPDPAGLPNGRRPNDDITDIGMRAFGGPAFFALRVGDGVNFADGVPGAGTGDGTGYGSIPGNRLDVTQNGIVKEFPFLPTPYDGRNSTSDR